MPHNKLNREGVFLARIIDQAVKQSTSGAVMLDLLLACTAQYDKTQEAYVDLTEPEECYGSLCLVKKDGTVMQSSVERLTAALGTSITDFDLLQESDWSTVEVQITVKGEEYDGRTIYRASWISPASAPVGGGTLTRASAEALASLNATFGAQLRALAPPAPVAAAPAAVTRVAAPPAPADDIPF